MALVTAAEAGRAVMEQQRSLNSSRYIPDMDPLVKEVSDANRLYIFNVGPWSHQRQLGSAGTYFVPACPAGQSYSNPIVIQGIENEHYPVNETECATLPKCGRPGQLRGDGQGLLFAQQILGEGPMLPAHSSLRPFGVFISKTKEPTEEDLSAARFALRQRQGELVAEANEIYVTDREHAGTLISSQWHRKAALDLGKTVQECPWLGESIAPAERKKCPSCGTPYEVGVAECAKCGDVLDEDKYAEKLARLERAKGGRKSKAKQE